MKKLCSGCGVKKAQSSFTKDASKADGLHTRCKDCKNGQARRPPRKKPEDEAREAAITRLIERHQGEFIKLEYSERVRLGIVEPTYKLGYGWRGVAV